MLTKTNNENDEYTKRNSMWFTQRLEIGVLFDGSIEVKPKILHQICTLIWIGGKVQPSCKNSGLSRATPSFPSVAQEIVQQGDGPPTYNTTIQLFSGPETPQPGPSSLGLSVATANRTPTNHNHTTTSPPPTSQTRKKTTRRVSKLNPAQPSLAELSHAQQSWEDEETPECAPSKPLQPKCGNAQPSMLTKKKPPSVPMKTPAQPSVAVLSQARPSLTDNPKPNLTHDQQAGIGN